MLRERSVSVPGSAGARPVDRLEPALRRRPSCVELAARALGPARGSRPAWRSDGVPVEQTKKGPGASRGPGRASLSRPLSYSIESLSSSTGTGVHSPTGNLKVPMRVDHCEAALYSPVNQKVHPSAGSTFSEA